MGRINMCLLSSYADFTGKPLPVKVFSDQFRGGASYSEMAW